MFNTVLVANRGVIACRIMRTLERLGIRSVAVYAEADAESLHVRMASEAHSLGEGSAAKTYLDSAKLLAIARRSGARGRAPRLRLSQRKSRIRRALCSAAWSN